MNPDPLIQAAADLLTRFFDRPQPAQRLLAAHCRANPGLGSRQRGLLGEIFYAALRQRRRLDPDLALDPLALAVAAEGWVRRGAGVGPDPRPMPSPTPFPPPFPNIFQSSNPNPPQESPTPPAARAEAPMPPASGQDPAIAFSLPDWLWELLAAQYGAVEAAALAAALAEPAPVDLRVNLAACSREDCRAALRGAGLEARPTPYSPAGLRLEGRRPLQGLAPFRQGWLEVQDEGSQLIAPLLGPRPGQTLIDLCAGAGGKSLHLAALMGDRGRVVAADADNSRLKRLAPRQKRAGLRAIRALPIRHEGDARLRPWTGKADGVLVDAPCSGTGTLRRFPDLKWRLGPEQVESLALRQSALLAAGARLVRPGGRLLYATCSVLARENQDVAAGFLAEHPDFQPLPVAWFLEQAGISGITPEGAELVLSPHRHGVDGFFAALFQRRG